LNINKKSIKWHKKAKKSPIRMFQLAALVVFAGKNSVRAASITGKARSTALCGQPLGTKP